MDGGHVGRWRLTAKTTPWNRSRKRDAPLQKEINNARNRPEPPSANQSASILHSDDDAQYAEGEVHAGYYRLHLSCIRVIDKNAV